MSLYALVSPGGAAGCTTTALAVTLTWPKPVILAECDPAGGDILAGLFAGHLPAPRGLLGVAFEAGRGQKHQTARVMTFSRKLERDDRAEERVGQLQRDSGTVAGI